MKRGELSNALRPEVVRAVFGAPVPRRFADDGLTVWA